MISFKHTEALLVRGIKFLLFLIPFISLYISPSIVFPYITGKNFAFRIIIELAVALWLVLVFINKKKWFRNSPMLITVLVFTFIVGLADLLGVNPYKSFWSNYERMEGYITILHLTLYFLILKSILRTKKEWKVFFSLFIGVSIVICFFAITIPLTANPAEGLSRYAMEYGTRVHSTIGNPPFLASYLLLSICIGTILIVDEKRLYLKSVFIAVILLNIVVIYLTATRGVMLAGVAGIIILALLHILGRKSKNGKSLLRAFSIGVIVVITVASIALLALNYTDILDQGRTLSRFKSMSSDPSVKARLDVWKMALPAIKERPWLGWGQENFNAVYTLNPIELVAEHVWLDRAHNIVIDWLVTAGFLGLFSYLSVFVMAFYFIRRAFHKEKIKKSEATVIVIALVVYFIQNLFIFDTINTYLIFFALLAYIDNFELFVEPSAEKQEYNIGVKKIDIKFVSVFLIALLVFGVTTYHLNYKPIKQNLLSIRTAVLDNETLPTLAEEFEDILSINTFGNDDVRERMLFLANVLLQKQLFEEEGSLEFIQATASQLWQGISVNRYNLEYYKNLINFSPAIAQYEPSYIKLTEELINECLRLNPQFQWPYIAMADIYILKNDYAGAFENVKRLVDEDPENDTKQMKFALVAILISREDIVTNTFATVKRIRTENNEDIALSKEPIFSFFELTLIAENYMLINNYHQALRYYKKIAGQPEVYLKNVTNKRFSRKMSNVYRKISEIYLALGEEEKAVKEAGKAQEYSRNGFSR